MFFVSRKHVSNLKKLGQVEGLERTKSELMKFDFLFKNYFLREKEKKRLAFVGNLKPTKSNIFFRIKCSDYQLAFTTPGSKP